jgi:hypothetical protein
MATKSRFTVLARYSAELTGAELDELREFLGGVFGPRYGDDAWQHCLGGTHFLLRYDDRLAAHMANVPRTFWQAERCLRGVYGESMATARHLQGRGLGTVVATLAAADAKLHYEIGALGASKYAFYERLGWRRWAGGTYVVDDGRRRPAAPATGSVLFLLPPGSEIDPSADLCTSWRPGDIW